MSYEHQYSFQFQLVAQHLKSCQSGLKLLLEEHHSVELHFEEIDYIQTADLNRGGQVSFPVGVKSHNRVLITGDEEDVFAVLWKLEKMDAKTDTYSSELKRDQAAGNKKCERRISDARKVSNKQVASIRRESRIDILNVWRVAERQVRVIWLNLA